MWMAPDGIKETLLKHFLKNIRDSILSICRLINLGSMPKSGYGGGFVMKLPQIGGLTIFV
jgi:hypothetical protein